MTEQTETQYIDIPKDPEKIKAAIEAVLFTLGDSVPLELIAKAVELDEDTCRGFIMEMMREYEADNRGIQIIALEDSYQMCTKREMYDCLIRVTSVPRKNVLTDILLETLSIIAYKQPVTKMEISGIRGVQSDHSINKLIEYGLVQEVGRMDAPGRPILLGTTEEFLRRFGIGSLDDLPDMTPEQMEEIREQAEEEVEVQLKLNI